MPKYTQQIVVFLDILGFSSMLQTFEEDALNNNIPLEQDYHESQQLNKLIEIFRDSVEQIKNADCNYYLFSDNLCITIDYIDNDTEKPDLFIDILILISLLMKEFVNEGYFLRGGVDVGWFLDNRDIAVGQPLVTAYLLESKTAIYPRVMLSDKFREILNDYLEKNKLNDYSTFLAEKYLKEHEGLSYLNPFFYITNYEEKESKIDYLQTYASNINEKLNKFIDDEKIGPKYKWFAQEFNSFVSEYTNNNAYQELDNEQLDYSNDEITTIKNLIIDINGI